MKTMHANAGGALLLALLASTASLGAQDLPKVSFQGQVRPRMENRSPGDGAQGRDAFPRTPTVST